MSFSQATITHQYLNADGTPASGKVTFALLGTITNGGVTIVPNDVVVMLDNAGKLTQQLSSTLDASTIPLNVFWRVTESIQGAPERMFEIQVPSGGVAAELGSLMPGVTPPAFA